MALWKRKVPHSTEPGAPDGISVGGRDEPVGTPHYDPKKALAAHGIQLTAKADLTEGDLARDGGLKNPEQAGLKRKKTVIGKDDGPGPAESGSVASSEMKEVKPKVNESAGKVGIMEDEMAVRKDPGVAGDNDPAASPSLVGPGFQWHKLPPQKPLTEGKKSPKVVLAGAQHASQPNSGYIEKDSTDTEPTTEWENNRPRWMEYPGAGGKDPVYASQKPGKDGNNDELFAKNIMVNSPPVNPVDADSYYFW
jgi:hypothetical protein